MAFHTKKGVFEPLAGTIPDFNSQCHGNNSRRYSSWKKSLFLIAILVCSEVPRTAGVSHAPSDNNNNISNDSAASLSKKSPSDYNGELLGEYIAPLPLLPHQKSSHSKHHKPGGSGSQLGAAGFKDKKQLKKSLHQFMTKLKERAKRRGKTPRDHLEIKTETPPSGGTTTTVYRGEYFSVLIGSQSHNTK